MKKRRKRIRKKFMVEEFKVDKKDGMEADE